MNVKNTRQQILNAAQRLIETEGVIRLTREKGSVPIPYLQLW